VTAHTAAIASTTLPDGRHFIPEQVVVECEATRAFVERFTTYWTYDFDRGGWVSPATETGETT
jgi:hypothetical protein